MLLITYWSLHSSVYLTRVTCSLAFGASSSQPAASGAAFYPALASSLGRSEDRFSVRSGGSNGANDDAAARTNFNMTYNDDNIDNSSEKPVDYSQMYQENGSVYEQPITTSGELMLTCSVGFVLES